MSDIIQLSSKKFLAGCFILSCIILLIGSKYSIPSSVLAIEVFLTIIALFVFGSIRYQLDKNALTYGAMLIIAATFATGWWPTSELKQALQLKGVNAFGSFLAHHLFTLEGLDHLIHADTMLFILGLTFFVAVIAQTRILESVSFIVLRKNKGAVLPTLGVLTALVSFASGILDGVSMIGLLIRTMVIILFLAKIKDEMTEFAVILSTVITTVCGMWLAYGEPPNLIMKANLHPYLGNAFFLRYCLPVAIGSYLIIYWNLRARLRGQRVEMAQLDVLDEHTADVRFLQSVQHGEVPIPSEFVEENKELLGRHFDLVIHRLHRGEPLGAALIAEQVPEAQRKNLLGRFLTEDLADPLDQHYMRAASADAAAQGKEQIIFNALEKVRKQRVRAQQIGALSFIPFIGFLIWHGIDHNVPLFWASFAAFALAIVGIFPHKKTLRLAMKEAKHEYQEYLFLFPLFLSITLLQKSGFFEQISSLIHHGIAAAGVGVVAYIQYLGAMFLSALLDNNVVADFASRALQGLEISTLHLFSMAQIAGYAVGGCWTHIGSAQSVVAFAFIKKEIDPKFSPFHWIRLMTPIVIEISLFVTVVVFAENWLARFLG